MVKTPPKKYKNIKIEEDLYDTLLKRKEKLNHDNMTQVIRGTIPLRRNSIFIAINTHFLEITSIMNKNKKYLDEDLFSIDLVSEIHSLIATLILDEPNYNPTETIKLLLDTLKEKENHV